MIIFVSYKTIYSIRYVCTDMIWKICFEQLACLCVVVNVFSDAKISSSDSNCKTKNSVKQT